MTRPAPKPAKKKLVVRRPGVWAVWRKPDEDWLRYCGEIATFNYAEAKAEAEFLEAGCLSDRTYEPRLLRKAPGSPQAASPQAQRYPGRPYCLRQA